MLAIAGGKGGCGKTTTALGIARALVRDGRRPLVVDCDPDMPDLHHLAGVKQLGGVERLTSDEPIESATTESMTVPGVELLTAGDRDHIDSALRKVINWQGPVLLDLPPGIGPDAVRPLRHADWSLLVSTDQPAAAADTRQTARSARQLDAPPALLVVREECSGSDRPSVKTAAGQTHVPTVSNPFDHPQVEHAWAEAVRKLPLECLYSQ